VLEIEMKFAVADPAALEERLARFGFVPGRVLRQADHYFNHPQRDFAVTDEAFRLRVVGDQAEFTYKGPRLDRVAKTRLEIELPLAPTGRHEEDAKRMIEALGFRPVASVVKQRRQGSVEHQGSRITVARDSLERLGEFVELELVVEPERRAGAKQEVLAWAERLGLADPIDWSYLELVLGRRRGVTAS